MNCLMNNIFGNTMTKPMASIESTNRCLHKQSPEQIERFALWLAPKIGSARKGSVCTSKVAMN